MKRFPLSLSKKITERKENNALRSLMQQDGKVDFFSNDYLGVAALVFDTDAPSGSTGSRLISGNSDRTEQIEKDLAVFFKQESALLFNSGYDANLGFFSSVPLKGDTVIFDALVHASIRDGIRMSLANSYSFKHNDLDSLKQKLLRAVGNIYVVVESIYSMDGDQALLKEIVEVCKENTAYLVVDEAHSGGVFGDKGEGLVTELGLDELIFSKIVTFGKAYGSHGAVVLGPNDLHTYLLNFARSLIYTTALSPHAQERIHEAVETVAEMSAERYKLERNIALFTSSINEGKYDLILSKSSIQSIVVPGNSEVKDLAQKIQDGGFAVKAILSPTVPKGEERLRICLHSFNSEKEIIALSHLIND
ncbi:MAG: 8-amino-7-oxononanoate synthase [Arenicella sp.]|jgi:8-amino-7-oxononanoate synthase